MISSLNDLFGKINFGTPLSFENMTVVPIFHKNGDKLKYSALSDAIKKKEVEIEEVNESGRVPELIVKNKSDKLVLIVDGEQFVGAKQNRIINASVLIDKNSETVINVSCVEQGRWSYKSKHFVDSENMLNHGIRAKKMMDVNKSLKFSRNFVSDQGRIWDDVAAYSRRARVDSPTSSMDDVFINHKERLSKFDSAFPVQDGQKGVVVFINGKPTALEYISNSTVFKKNLSKIIRSYSSEALFSKEQTSQTDFIDSSRKFIDSIAHSTESTFKSKGLGDDFRYESDNVLASALVHESEVVHLVGFTPVTDSQKPPFIHRWI